MNALSPSVSVQYIRHMASVMANAGADVPTWLKAADLPKSALDSATAVLTLPQLQRLVENALSTLNEPALGVLVGERFRANTHGVLGFAAMQAHTMREVLQILQNFAAVRLDIVSFELVQRDAECWLLIHEPVPMGQIRLPVLEAVMMAVKHLIEFVGQGVCEVLRLEFSAPSPSYIDFAKRCFHCEVKYNTNMTALVLPAKAIDFALATSDPVALQSATWLCEKTLREKQGGHMVQARVRQLLLNNQGDFPSLDIAARLLGMTSRTLHRRLVQEGSSFSDLLEAVRHQLAIEFLRSGRVGTKEVAFRLGYQDMANFRRAFKRWEGCSPSEFVVRSLGSTVP